MKVSELVSVGLGCWGRVADGALGGSGGCVPSAEDIPNMLSYKSC